MTDLPYIFEMDPDDWFEQVQKIADDLREKIAAALDEHDSAEEVCDAIMPHIEPYIIDADDPSQHQLLAEADGDTFAIGQKGGTWHKLTYRDDGYWWTMGREPETDDPDPHTLHSAIAQAALKSVSWGDPDRARERAQTQNAKRTILEPYLEVLDDAGGLDATAVDLRGELKSLIDACLPDEERMSIDDRSPDDEHTHFTILQGDEEVGHVLAVSPGASRDPERLEDVFGVELSFAAGVRVVTDHLRFVWYPYLDSQTASNELILPSNKDDDIVDYYYEIDWTVSQLIRSLNPELKPDDD